MLGNHKNITPITVILLSSELENLKKNFEARWGWNFFRGKSRVPRPRQSLQSVVHIRNLDISDLLQNQNLDTSRFFIFHRKMKIWTRPDIDSGLRILTWYLGHFKSDFDYVNSNVSQLIFSITWYLAIY